MTTSFWIGPATNQSRRLPSVLAVPSVPCASGLERSAWSARVKDGWSQRGLRKLLRVSRARLRHLVASGMLRVRDPRITASSLEFFCERNIQAIDTCAIHMPKHAIGEEEAYSWKRAAKALGNYGGKCTEPDFRRPTQSDGYVCY